MSTSIVANHRVSSLSSRPQPALRRGVAYALAALLPLFSACNDLAGCQYRCTADESACPDQLTCDVTLGYCVSEGYVGTCDAETHEVTVCKGEAVELAVPDSVTALEEAEGLPDSADFEDGRINATFSKPSVFAFGAPNQTRQYFRVEIADDCPVVDTELAALCVGETISQTLATHGGEGELTFELLDQDGGFSVSRDGILSGAATTAGDRELAVSVTDERGLETVRTVTVAVSSECPDVSDALPKSCAGAEYEAPLVLEGLAPVEATDFTPTQKDGKGLSAKEAEDLVKQLAIKLVPTEDRYLVTAAPARETLGDYLFTVKLENDVRVEQRDISFGVKECSAVQADFTVCEDETFDLDLEGAPGDVWTFYDPANPLEADVSFVEERRLRGVMPNASPRYDIKARVKNPAENTDRVVTLTLAVLSHLEPYCSLDSGVASPESTSSAASETSSTAPVVELDADVPPFQEESLDEGCVAKPYEFAVPLSGITSGTWQASGLPAGLSIDESGVISGALAAPFDGVVDVSGLRSGANVSKSFHLTVHEWCSVVFKGVPDGSTQTHLYQIDRRSNVNQVELSTGLGETEEVVNFSLSPSQQHVAFSVHDDYTDTTRVVVKRRLPLATGQSESLIVGNITAAPFDGAVTELSWGTTGRISLLTEKLTSSTDDTSPDVDQTLFVYDVTKVGPATTATKILQNTVTEARDLVWLDATPCVTLAKAQGSARATTCWNFATAPSTSGEAITGHFIYNAFDGYQVRGHEGRFLQAQPAGVGSIMRLYSWMPNELDEDNYPYVLHKATFASPLGDLVATIRDNGMEIAHAYDPTMEEWVPDAGDNFYVPLGTVPDCTSVDAWRGGGALACSTSGQTPSGTPGDQVTIAIPTEDEVTLRPTFEAAGHSTSGRRIFLGNSYYLYDDLDGRLHYVEVGANPPQALTQSHGEGRHAVALEPLDDSHFVMQGPNAMWVGAISSGSLGLTEVNGGDKPAAFSECESAFAWNGFATWCGGDEISRRFQVAPDRELGVFQTEDSNLALFSISSASQLKRAQDVRVSCGDHPYCLTEFEVAR